MLTCHSRKSTGVFKTINDGCIPLRRGPGIKPLIFTIPVKTVRCFANNKPWITSDIKQLLNQKKQAFRNGDRVRLRGVQHELRRTLKQAKVDYKNKVEGKLRDNNIKEVWKGMRNITGFKKKNGQVFEEDVDKANDFNQFYNRFDRGGGCCPDPAGRVSPAVTSVTSTTSDTPSAAAFSSSLVYPLCCSGIPKPVSAAPTTTLLLTLPSWSSLTGSCHLSSASVDTATSDQRSLSLTIEEVRAELRRLHTGKAAGPDGVCPKLLKDCATQLAEPLHNLFNLSLQTEKVPVLWKTSCLVPVPKTGRPVEMNDYRPVALTSHIMKTLERLILRHLKPQVAQELDPLQFAYQEHIGVEDAVLFMLHRAYAYLDVPGSYVRIMFFDFSSAFNTIQPLILRDKLVSIGVAPSLTNWITDYLTSRLQFVKLGKCVSGSLECSTGAPQGTVLAPFLFTLYTSDFKYNSESCHIQKYSDDTAVVACVRAGTRG